jgi:hypothetical protein
MILDIGLPILIRSSANGESEIQNLQSQIEMTGALRFELRNSVLETDSFPISLRSYCDFGFEFSE